MSLFDDFGQLEPGNEINKICNKFTLELSDHLRDHDYTPAEQALIQVHVGRLLGGTFAQKVLDTRLTMRRESQGWFELNDAEKAVAKAHLGDKKGFNKKIRAITMLRKRKGAGLKEAKDAVDRYLDTAKDSDSGGQSVPCPTDAD